jgi:putative mycofactocin binding protein MftB
LSDTVSLRPEPFGALVYDYATRRLSFLKTKTLVAVVQQLEHQPDAASALAAAGVTETQWSAYLSALAGLAEAGTIAPRAAISTTIGEA